MSMEFELLRRNLDAALSKLNHLAITEDQIDVEDKVQFSSGGYGDVFKATLKGAGFSRNRLVAVKDLRSAGDDLNRIRLAIHLARELRVWANLKHQNVLELLGFYLNPQMTVARLISPFMANGNIMNYLTKIQPPDSLRIKLLTDALRGLLYLHSSSPPVCHADIKPENVLITDQVAAVLCDFGLARFVDGQRSGLTTTETIKGSLRYMSPELLDGDPVHTLQSDIWAFGCLVLKPEQVMTGILPYIRAKSDQQVLLALALKQAPADMDSLRLKDAGLRRLLPMCWEIDPSARASALDCMRCLPAEKNAYSSTPLPRKAAVQATLLWKLEGILSVASSIDGRILALLHADSSSTVASIRFADSGETITKASGDYKLEAVYFSDDRGMVALITNYGSVCVWRFDPEPEVIEDSVWKVPPGIVSLSFSSNFSMMAYICNGLPYIWWSPQLCLQWDQAYKLGPGPTLHNLLAGSITISSDSRFAAISVAARPFDVHIWSISDGALLARLEGHTRQAGWLGFSPDGSRLRSTTLDNSEFKIWDTSSLLGFRSGSAADFPFLDCPCIATFTTEAE
ncbi:hypothetical protein FRC01_005949, partial [Tulasnella sp. 417]